MKGLMRLQLKKGLERAKVTNNNLQVGPLLIVVSITRMWHLSDTVQMKKGSLWYKWSMIQGS